MRRAPVLVPIAFGAGLATGLARFQPLLAAVLLLAALLALRRRPGAWYAGVALAGLAAGTAARLRDARGCAATLPAGDLRLAVVVEEPVPADGGLVRARPVSGGCAGSVTLRLPRAAGAGDALRFPAGARLEVEGAWLPRPRALGRPDGLLAVRRATPRGVVPSPGAALRTWLARASAELYGERAALVDALVTGRRSGMELELREAFAASGLVHLLSISGFHVGVIVTWLVLLLRWRGVARERALLLAAAAASAYVVFLGWPAPAARAALLAWLLAFLRWRQRAVQPDAALGCTALVVLVADPWAIADLGAWLSVAALWGATRAARWSDAELAPHPLVRLGASSVGATLATAPLTAATLGAVAPVGILLNFAAIPLAAIAVPGVLASLLAQPLWPEAARSVAAGAGACLALLEGLAKGGAAVPFGHLVTAAEPRSALPWLALLGALVWTTARHVTRGVALTRGLAAAAAAAWLPLLGAGLPGGASATGRLALHFLDVGQGDAAVLVTPAGRVILVDAGPAGRGADAGRRTVVPFLRRAGVRRVDLLVASHGHLDHVGGAPAVLRSLPVAAVLEPGAPMHEPAYLAFLDAAASAGARWDAGEAGERFEVDGVRFTVLHPVPGWPGWGEDPNEDSVVLLVEYGAFRALFAGDAGLPAEERLRGRVGRVDVLKVGHHGSRGSTGAAWLAELRPEVGVVSVGRNTYGHPHPEALGRLAAAGSAAWRTDQQGSIAIVTDGRTVEVRGRSHSCRFEAGAAPPSPTSTGEPRGPCRLPSPPSSASSSTRNAATRTPPASSRTSSTTSPSPPS